MSLLPTSAATDARQAAGSITTTTPVTFSTSIESETSLASSSRWATGRWPPWLGMTGDRPLRPGARWFDRMCSIPS